MSKTSLIAVACALGALLTQSSFAAGVPRAIPAGNIVPAGIAPPASREREINATGMVPVSRQDTTPVTRGTAQPSALDREIGIASDGGYTYYDGYGGEIR